jgi:hypothetical protein
VRAFPSERAVRVVVRNRVGVFAIWWKVPSLRCASCGSHMHAIGACPALRARYARQARKPQGGRNLPPQKGAQLKRKYPQEVVDNKQGKGHRVNNKDSPIKQYRAKGRKHTVKPAGKSVSQAKTNGCLFALVVSGSGAVALAAAGGELIRHLL